MTGNVDPGLSVMLLLDVMVGLAGAVVSTAALSCKSRRRFCMLLRMLRIFRDDVLTFSQYLACFVRVLSSYKMFNTMDLLY